jgi:hypothetical protein
MGPSNNRHVQRNHRHYGPDAYAYYGPRAYYAGYAYGPRYYGPRAGVSVGIGF